MTRRIILLIILPLAGLAWMAQGFSRGELLLAAVLTIGLYLAERFAAKKDHADVD